MSSHLRLNYGGRSVVVQFDPNYLIGFVSKVLIYRIYQLYGN